MKLITVAGPPSCGKTAVIAHTLSALKKEGAKAGVVKFDCLTTEDGAVYKNRDIPVIVGLSAGQCPDHFYISNLTEALKWAKGKNLDYLVSESAGLCNRCSPHLKNTAAVCVLDYLSGFNTPKKIGPMLKMADIIVLTKGDIVTQAEREVFAYQCLTANPKAEIISVNGLTGQCSLRVASIFRNAPDISDSELQLRFPMPSALCQYCLGETRVGEQYRMGNYKRMKIE